MKSNLKRLYKAKETTIKVTVYATYLQKANIQNT